MAVQYDDIAAAVEPTGMVARGGFAPAGLPLGEVGGRDSDPVRCVIVIGNIGRRMWPQFRREERAGPDPLDTWTRSVLAPIAARFGATYVHPSDRPFRPFQRWAALADDVWPSPIGLLVHPDHGLWHAYRGAFLVPDDVVGLPPVGGRSSPCVTCADQPCLSACPVGAFTTAGYEVDACRGHVGSGAEPRCRELGCAARLACPVGIADRYGPDQMAFHMRAFLGPGAAATGPDS